MPKEISTYTYELYLKNGHVVTFMAKDVDISSVGMSWTTSDMQAKDRLLFVDHKEIVAVKQVK